MFDHVRNNKRLVQVFLALIMLPFAFWGMDSLVSSGGSGEVAASVGNSKVSAQEFQRALREQQDRLRPALGGRDPGLLDTPELRQAVIEGLVNQRLIGVHAAKAKISVSDEQLVRFISAAPSLQEDGKFSPQRYEMLVASQGMSRESFEARVRQDLAMQQAMMPLSEAVLPGRAATDRWVGAQLEEREIAEIRFLPEQYAGQVKLAPDAALKYYEANRKKFEQPEQARVEYIVLSQEALTAQQAVGEDEIKSYFQSHADRFKVAEERQASHILITANKDAPAAEDKAARAKAEEVLAQLKKNPAEFPRLARQYSQDPGSAGRGGDLGWFGRGMMVPPFEQAVYALRENEISAVVRSDFGYHVIRLTGVRPERTRPLDEVKAEISDELKRLAAAKKYAELAEGFTNVVYEQADSLAPAAEKYHLKIESTQWMSRNGQAVAPFTHPKLMAAVFAEDTIKNKRNTEAVEVAPNTLVAARIVEHRPATLQALESVKAAIEKELIREEAVKLAAKDGADKLARLTKGEKVDLGWSASRVIARAQAPNLSRDAVKAVFRADAAHLPAYAGAAGASSYVLYRITQVKPHVGDTEETPQAKALREQYRQIIAEEEFSGWLGALRQRFPVEINKGTVDTREK